jgi:hypothetical protein
MDGVNRKINGGDNTNKMGKDPASLQRHQIAQPSILNFTELIPGFSQVRITMALKTMPSRD